MNNSYHSEVCPKCQDPWCHGCPSNEEFHAERDVAGRISLPWSQELDMQALDAKLDPDGMGPEGQQAWNAFQKEQAIEPTWEERERQDALERLAYCGWEEF